MRKSRVVSLVSVLLILSVGLTPLVPLVSAQDEEAVVPSSGPEAPEADPAAETPRRPLIDMRIIPPYGQPRSEVFFNEARQFADQLSGTLEFMRSQPELAPYAQKYDQWTKEGQISPNVKFRTLFEDSKTFKPEPGKSYSAIQGLISVDASNQNDLWLGVQYRGPLVNLLRGTIATPILMIQSMASLETIAEQAQGMIAAGIPPKEVQQHLSSVDEINKRRTIGTHAGYQAYSQIKPRLGELGLVDWPEFNAKLPEWQAINDLPESPEKDQKLHDFANRGRS